MRNSAVRRLRLILGIFISLIVLIGLLLYSLKLIEPSSPPQNILVSNITDHQASISWTTAKPTRGLIVISEDGKFPLLPTFAKKTYKDDGEKNLKRTLLYTTHHVTVGDLAPNKTYQYLIYQGWKKIIQGVFTTCPTLTSISGPQPVYGQVIDEAKKPIIGALVYLVLKNDKSQSALLSTLTNDQGRWQLDLGNARSAGLKNTFSVTAQTQEELVVEVGIRGKGKITFTPGNDAPAPIVILTKQ